MGGNEAHSAAASALAHPWLRVRVSWDATEHVCSCTCACATARVNARAGGVHRYHVADLLEEHAIEGISCLAGSPDPATRYCVALALHFVSLEPRYQGQLASDEVLPRILAIARVTSVVDARLESGATRVHRDGHGVACLRPPQHVFAQQRAYVQRKCFAGLTGVFLCLGVSPRTRQT